MELEVLIYSLLPLGLLWADDDIMGGDKLDFLVGGGETWETDNSADAEWGGQLRVSS